MAGSAALFSHNTQFSLKPARGCLQQLRDRLDRIEAGIVPLVAGLSFLNGSLELLVSGSFPEHSCTSSLSKYRNKSIRCIGLGSVR